MWVNSVGNYDFYSFLLCSVLWLLECLFVYYWWLCSCFVWFMDCLDDCLFLCDFDVCVVAIGFWLLFCVVSCG